MALPIQHADAHLSNGVRLHVASCGDASRPLMLFLHGFPEFWQAWEALLPEFGQTHHAVAPDLRGFNLSDQPKEVEKYRAKHIVEDIRLLIRHLGHTKCILVAHDWGGAIAWSVAAQHPDLIDKLVIINSPHPGLFVRDLTHSPAQIAASQYMNLLRRPDAEAIMGADDNARMVRLLRGVSQNLSWFTPELEADYLACWNRGLTGGLNYYRASPVYPATATEPGATALQLPREMVTIRVPTLVIWGMQDEALLPSLLDGLDDYIPDLRIERVEDGSHWVVHEHSQQVSALIRSFIA